MSKFPVPKVQWFIAASMSTLLCACGGGSDGATSASTSNSSGSGSGIATAPGTTDVLTYHNDSMRTGQNLTETVLTPTNVNSTSFGLLKTLAADGLVDATPLVASAVTIGTTAHTVIYVATENDTVYAYDADTFALLAQASMLASGESASTYASPSCSQVTPKIGITATPVIDRSVGPNGTLFVVAMSEDASGHNYQRVHALDLTTLADRVAPVTIAATHAGTGANSTGGVLTFDPKQYKERSALVVSGGQLYTSWASNCDIDPYNSWIMAFSESTLAQTQILNLTPNGTRGAIWNTGGVLADSAGALYALLGNGTYDASQDYGNAAVKLTSTGSALTVADYFTPSNTVTESASDLDFGSGSPMLLPDQTDASGATRQLMFAAGKDGFIFLLDRTNLGKFSASGNQVYQQISGALSAGLFSAPAYFNGSLYVGGVNAPLYAYTLAGAMLPNSASSQSAQVFSRPGTSPSVSANGTTNGIVWAVQSAPGAAAVLHAYNPANLAVEYYNSTQAANGRDSFGNGNKFITPVIADGRVFVGTPAGVAVFGLL
jgi:hypothetical protein